jgi:YHS domain-containing protein
MLLRYVLIGILIIFIARAFWRVVDGIIDGLTGGQGRARMQSGVKMERDPVCGTFVVPDATLSLGDGRRRVFFCSPRCRDKYRARTA